MSSPKRSDKCLLEECQTGDRNLVFIPSAVNLHNKLIPGDVLPVESQGKHGPARSIASSDDLDLLETMSIATERDQQAGPSTEPDEEAEEDYSLSNSSWKPSCTISKAYSLSKQNAVQDSYWSTNKCAPQAGDRDVRNSMLTAKDREQQAGPSTEPDEEAEEDYSLSDSSWKPSDDDEESDEETSPLSPTEKWARYKKYLHAYNLLYDITSWNQNYESYTESKKKSREQRIPEPVEVEDTRATNHTLNNQSVEVNIKNGNEEENENENENDEFNRSDDTVLITNKHATTKTIPKKVPAVGEWIPIGSGKTLIHNDKFKKINWKSYKKATRTMLLAVFDRRTLATHSLTGKRSPAFKNIAAKMCLDPKIVSDVVIEIMDRFNVKEREVRKVITHKCGDERKIWKFRIRRKKPEKKGKMPPSSSNTSNEQSIPEPVKAEGTPAINHTPNNQSVEVNVKIENVEQNENVEFNRSGDTVLISNERATMKTIPKKVPADGEWVPIGSGKTLIHKDKFKRINWKSYTIATRTMLLAVFDRRTLATHSLTGKRSPAFQNKPAKMRLDPDIVSDIIIEIMERFNEEESNVRSVITIKCADECKMWKTRTKRKLKTTRTWRLANTA